MSMERSFEAWEEVQRQGQDIADRFNSLAQGFTGLIHTHMSSPPFSWPNHISKPLDLEHSHEFAVTSGVPAIFDIGGRLGRAGAEFGAYMNGVVHQFFRRLPLPFKPEENPVMNGSDGKSKKRLVFEGDERESLGSSWRGLSGGRPTYSVGSSNDGEEFEEEDGSGFQSRLSGVCNRHQGSINITTMYDSRTRDIESSVVARGDLWRAEASHGGSTSGNDNSPVFLIQLGPVLFVRDTTLLLPVHLSKQHLLWYGFDRKNGMHSLCPAIWSKHRRWLLMSMICLNPLACSFMDLQFPNGQLTYVSGEGLTTSAFLPVLGGLLQAQGRYPGETRLSFSFKIFNCLHFQNKLGTRITPMVQVPDKSVSLGIVQALAWQKSGLMVRPTIQVSVCPTFGGSNPGLRAEIIHSVREKLSLICGFARTMNPSAFASVALKTLIRRWGRINTPTFSKLSDS
ncbi:hypothetical protein AMTRI_Chr01g109890 [Amborella trichopoda]